MLLVPDMAVNAAQPLKDDEVVVISLGLSVNPGTNVKKTQLEHVASSQSHVIVTSYPSDNTHISELVSMMCSGKERKCSVRYAF